MYHGPARLLKGARDAVESAGRGGMLARRRGELPRRKWRCGRLWWLELELAGAIDSPDDGELDCKRNRGEVE